MLHALYAIHARIRVDGIQIKDLTGIAITGMTLLKKMCTIEWAALSQKNQVASKIK